MKDMALAFAFTAFILWLTMCPERKYSTTEWREAMRKQKLGVK